MANIADDLVVMDTIQKELEEETTAYNSAVLLGNFAEMAKLDAKMKDQEGQYVAAAKRVCFKECSAMDDPMVEAVKRGGFDVIRIKDSKVGDEKIPVREIVVGDRPIDLYELHKYVDGGIGKDKKWPYMVENFNMQMAMRTALDMGWSQEKITHINDSYAMKKLSREYSYGEEPCSNENMEKTLNTLVHAMIGDQYNIGKVDIAYLFKTYTKKAKTRKTVATPNHKVMRSIVMDICHNVLFGGDYGMTWKERKAKERREKELEEKMKAAEATKAAKATKKA